MTRSILFAALLAASAVASAASNTAVLKDRLKGMTEVSDGLYAKVEGDHHSYFATNAKGRAAIADIMGRNNAAFAKLYAVDGISDREQGLLDESDRIQKALLKPAVLAKDYQTGNCSSGAALVAQAYSSGGTSASAYAQNALDFSPATPTNNYAYARTSFTSDDDSTVGLTQAAVSENHPWSCFAEAYAYVTCPTGYTGGAGPAYAYSGDPGEICIEP